MNFDDFDRALIFAAKAHDGQVRKGTDVPYLVHPVAVAATLLAMHCDDAVILAALLHDTVEDTAATLADIEREFGPEVAAIVAGASEPDKSAAWKVRKQHTIHYLKTAPPSVRLVACADKLHNLRSMMRDHAELGDAVWQRFKRGRAEQGWYYREVIKSLLTDEALAQKYPIFSELKRLVEQFFGEA